MLRLIDWLRANKTWNIVILLIYYLLVVLPHEWVGLMTVKIFGGYTRDTYNAIILVIALISLSLYLIPLFLNIRKGTRQGQQWFYFASTVALASYTLYALFVVNIEVVHYVQYCVFAILCYPLVNNYVLTLIWVTMMGSLDEAYQYFYLSPERTEYYDWNDVITNLIGGGFGLVWLRSYEIKSQFVDVLSFLRSKTFIALATLVVSYFILLNTNYLDLYQTENSEAVFYMVKKKPDGWWSLIHPNVIYHIMLPLEGALVTVALWVFYRFIGRF